MGVLDKLGLGIVKRKESRGEEEEEGESERGAERVMDIESIFADSEKEKARVEEWWLQKGEEEAVEEVVDDMIGEDRSGGRERGQGEGENADADEDSDSESESESEKDIDELIYSLKDDEEEEDEMSGVLRSAVEEFGDTSVEELLILGKTALHEVKMLSGAETGGHHGE